MKFPGYWISGDAQEIVIMKYDFDETELSEASEWKEAHQNEDPSLPHGFVHWEDAIADAQKRLRGDIACPPARGGANSVGGDA